MLLPPNIVTLSNRIYSLMLYLYPASFRREFGRDMAQLFQDVMRQTLREAGVAGVARLWLSIAVDLCQTVPAQHRWELVHSSQHRYVRLSGVAATAGGIVWSTPWLLPWISLQIGTTSQLLMSLFGLILVAIGLTGLHIRLQAGGSRLSAAAYAVSLLGLTAVISPVLFVLKTGPQPNGVALRFVMAGVVCFMLGLMSMGVITLSRRALGPLSFVPLALALCYLLLIVSMQLGQTVPTTRRLIPIFLTVDMFCWLLLGRALLTRSRQLNVAP